MSESCPADASSDERSSPDGQQLRVPVLPPSSLPAAIQPLVDELRQTNQLLQVLTAQNQALIELLVEREEQDETQTLDMEGNPIKVT